MANVNDLFSQLLSLDRHDKSTLTGSVWAVFSVCLVVDVVVLGLRAYVRIRICRDIRLDDYLIFGAGVLNFVFRAATFEAIKFGLGQHIVQLSQVSNFYSSIQSMVRLLFIANIFEYVALDLTKLSMIASITYIFATERLLRIAMQACAAVVVTSSLVAVGGIIFQCKPVYALWNFDILLNGQARCINLTPFIVAGTASVLVADLVIFVFPLPYCWRLKLPLRRKLLLCFFISMGLIATICSIIRLRLIASLGLIDVTYTIVPSFNLVHVETSLGIFCSSLPRLRPLFQRFKGRLPGSKSAVSKSAISNVPASSRNGAGAIASGRLPRGSAGRGTCADKSVITSRAAAAEGFTWKGSGLNPGITRPAPAALRRHSVHGAPDGDDDAMELGEVRWHGESWSANRQPSLGSDGKKELVEAGSVRRQSDEDSGTASVRGREVVREDSNSEDINMTTGLSKTSPRYSM